MLLLYLQLFQRRILAASTICVLYLALERKERNCSQLCTGSCQQASWDLPRNPRCRKQESSRVSATTLCSQDALVVSSSRLVAVMEARNTPGHSVRQVLVLQ